MVVGFLSMLLSLLFLGLARSKKEGDVPRYEGAPKLGLFVAGGLFMGFGLILCVGRMIEWSNVVAGF